MLDALANNPLLQLLLLVIGHSQGGKTTLIHALACRLAAMHVDVIVCDPDAAPGLWPGCAVHGYANDLAAIDRALADVKVEVDRRRALRGSGRQRTFAPLYLVIDEYQDIGRAGGCPEARELVEDVLRRGCKLNIHLIIGVQDKQVKTMGFEGQGDLRRNFTSVVEIRADRSGRRWVTITEPIDEEATATYAVPDFPNLEQLVESTTRQDTDMAVHALPATTAAQARTETLEKEVGNLHSLETDFQASEGDFTISDVAFSLEEIAQIAAMIASSGKGKTEVVQAMPGYSSRKHKAYAACYDRLRAAVDGGAANGRPA
jgi:energy-coupling factor transporter ATP-binding protein EcfA2